MSESREVKATEAHLVLLHDLMQCVSCFNQEHQEMDVVEVFSVLGSAAGAFISNAPDEAERTRARQSVINSMDSAITDFSAERGKRERGLMQ